MAKLTVSVEGTESIIQQLEKLADVKGTVKAGIMEGSENYADVMVYAPVQEFGGKIKVTDKMRGYLAYNYGIYLKKSTTHITIPSRPFMRTTFQQHWKEWAEILAHYLTAGVASETVLELVGRRMEDDIRDTIMNGQFKPLSEATILIERQSERGPGNAEKTLYESGQMAHSIRYEVIPE